MSVFSSLTRAGMSNQLAKIISGFLTGNIWVHLSASYPFGPIGETTTLAQLVAGECTFSGYGPQLAGPWSAPVLQFGVGGLSQYAMTSAFATWNISAVGGTGNINGYYLTDSTFSILYGATELQGVIPIQIPQGEIFNLQVEYLLFSYFPYPPVAIS